MDRDSKATDRLGNLVSKIEALTTSGELRWQRQTGSAHRYARWNNNLLILGPAAPLTADIPRYLFITPFDSPDCIEINSADAQLGSAVMNLVREVEVAVQDQAANDPFSMTEEVLDRLEST
jgi:hypothetical protein